MRIERAKIRDFRNLKDLKISFTASSEDSDGTKHDFKSHAIIGQNGSGKSNLLEAIITIFRDLDLNNAASLNYEMDYSIRGHSISLTAYPARNPR